VAKVKNKAPAEIQITAEQLLREVKGRGLEILPPLPKQNISDPDELADYQHRKRRTSGRIVQLLNMHSGRKIKKKSKGLGPYMRGLIGTSHYG
jgi:hypothetical protein